MALLGHHARTRRAALLALLLFCSACAVLRGFLPGSKRFAFSHERHVTLEKLECANCHSEAFAADDPGLPARDTCDVCHSEIDAERPPEKRIDVLFRGEQYAAAHAARLPREVVFSHKLHAAGKQACNACHAGIEHAEGVLALAPPRMDDCTRCHAQRSVAPGSGCALCHREVSQRWKPANHAANWRRAHGPVARDDSGRQAERCELCHTQASCDACHRNEAPQSHTPFWHERAHGLAALAERQDCAACHAPASCDRCHQETRPRSHTGSWGGTLATHCLGCHQPLRSEECSACHRSNPGHLSATHTPPDHFPGMNCRQCHGLSAPLPHVDNGDDCSSCHH